MSTATLTSKGQITVPKEVRDDLHLQAGSKVMFVKISPGNYRIVARTGRLEDLAGLLHRPGQQALTIDEIEEGIGAGAAMNDLTDDATAS